MVEALVVNFGARAGETAERQFEQLLLNADGRSRLRTCTAWYRALLRLPFSPAKMLALGRGMFSPVTLESCPRG
jgi:hypothetical protein